MALTLGSHSRKSKPQAKSKLMCQAIADNAANGVIIQLIMGPIVSNVAAILMVYLAALSHDPNKRNWEAFESKHLNQKLKLGIFGFPC